MELSLNLLWLLLAVASFAFFWRGGDDRKLACAHSLRRISSLACALVIFFPIISLADDLHAAPVVMEDSNPAKRISKFSGAPGSAATEIDGDHLLDLVMVEPKGRGPQGSRFQIVLDSATRGAESSLDLVGNAAGLLVSARDVDGIGNDLDLIIKSANSFTPIGVWINNHHGGFIKVDASVYAPSIWSDPPLILSFNLTETIQGAIVLWHQSHVQPSTQGSPGERWALQALVEPTDLKVPSRLTSDPQQTRGPPSSCLTSF